MDSGHCAHPRLGANPTQPDTQFKIKAMPLVILRGLRHFKLPYLTSIKFYWSRILCRTHLPLSTFNIC